MVVYRGVRTGNGCVVEWRHHGEGDECWRRLNPRYDLRTHSPDGFEWGYGGSGPSQLALAILAHHYNPTYDASHGVKHAANLEAVSLYQQFKFRVVAGFRTDHWELTSSGIDEAVEAIKSERVGG